MGSILFWNLAGSGVGKAEEFIESLTAYAGAYKPDCVVVCEMRKLSFETKRELSFLDYKYVKPSRPQNTVNIPVDFYKSDNDKRLYVYAPNPGAIATQISTGSRRPVIHLTVANTSFFVMHAPSYSSTSGPQARQMMSAYDIASQLVAGKKVAGMPQAIFGDLNVDLRNADRRRSLYRHFFIKQHRLFYWLTENSGRPTHHNKKTGNSSELDWALRDPGFKCKVYVADLSHGKKTKDEDMDWNGTDQSVTKKSDHEAMVLEW